MRIASVHRFSLYSKNKQNALQHPYLIISSLVTLSVRVVLGSCLPGILVLIYMYFHIYNGFILVQTVPYNHIRDGAWVTAWLEQYW